MRKVLLAFTLIGGLQCSAQPKLKPGLGSIQGYVTENGKPVTGAHPFVIVPEGKYDGAVPVMTPSGVGVVGFRKPKMIVYPEPRTDKNGHYELVFRTGYVQVRVTKSLKKPDLRIVRIVEVKDRQRTTQDFELEARWHSAEVAVNSFNDGIGSILASAKEKPPLMSIASGVPTTGGYSSHVTLPGADYCGIMMPGLPDGTVKWPAFVCQATYDSHERALEDYNLLVKLVAGATGFTPTPSKLSTIFGGDGLIVGDSLTVSISEKEVVDLTYTTAGRSDVLHVP